MHIPIYYSGHDTPLETVSMHTGISTMLLHRQRPSKIMQTEQRKDSVLYTLEGGATIICFRQSIKKSDILSIVGASPPLDNLILTCPTISRPALLLATTHQIEVINEDLYSFDRMKSALLPTYNVMTEGEIVHLETKHKCPRTFWPILPREDPLALYLGFKTGVCVFTCDKSGVVNVRYVK